MSCETCGGEGRITIAEETTRDLGSCPDCTPSNIEKLAAAEVECPCLIDPHSPDAIGCNFCGGITSPHSKYCEHCHGTGTVPAYPWARRVCGACDGYGIGYQCGGHFYPGDMEWVPCDNCVASDCKFCQGRGWFPLPDAELLVEVMARCNDEFLFRRQFVKGKGWFGYAEIDGYYAFADKPLPDNPDVDAVIHALAEALAGAYMKAEGQS